MADHIPFVTSKDTLELAWNCYGDSQILRVPLDRADKLKLKDPAKMWLDPCVDGLHDSAKHDKTDYWLKLMVSKFWRVTN